MKSLTLLLAFTALYTPILNAQDFKFDGDTMTVVFESGLDKKNLHLSVFASVANIYNSANDVVQMNNAAAGKIIVKGTSEVALEDPNKITEPKNDLIPRYIEYNVKHTLNIDIKDNKYRLRLNVGEKYLYYLGQKFAHTKISVPWLTFETPSDAETQDYVEKIKKSYAESRWTKGLLKKKKHIAYFDAIPSIWKQNVGEFRQMAKDIAVRINTGVVNASGQDDDW